MLVWVSVKQRRDMHRGVVDVLDGTYFVFFERSLSRGMTFDVIRAFDTIEIAGTDETSGMVRTSDAIRPPGAIGTSGATETSEAIKMFGSAVKASGRPVETVVTGVGTDTGADGLVGLGFCPSGEKSETSPDAELTCGCLKAIVTVGEGSGCLIKDMLGACITRGKVRAAGTTGSHLGVMVAVAVVPLALTPNL
jgi:hypothetical protein